MPVRPSSASSAPSRSVASDPVSRVAAHVIENSEAALAGQMGPGLYVVATPIGHALDITLRALMVLHQADIVACEDTRVSGPLLARYGLRKKLVACHDHNEAASAPALIEAMRTGKTVALISDAGTPLVADPGYRLVQACRAAKVKVTVIPGASAVLTALQLSGLPSDQFHFAGFLPVKGSARTAHIRQLKQSSATLIVLEAPHRLAVTLKDLAAALGARECAVTRELTKKFEEVRRGTLAELATDYDGEKVKGEITLVIAPKSEETEEIDLPKLLRAALKDASVRDAVEQVAAATGLAKREVYAAALKLKKK